MKEYPLNIVFMGTPEIGSESLSVILELAETNIIDLKCVYTKQPIWNSKKKEYLPPPVYSVASNLGVKILTPGTLKNNSAEIEFLKSIRPDLIVVVAFGLILPSDILHIPKLGAINLHPSLLPELRGPSPINFAILNRLKYSGVSIMVMDEGVDSGPVIAQNKVDIGKDENYGELYSRLSKHGAFLLKEVIKTIYKLRIHAKEIAISQDSQFSESKMVSNNDRIVNLSSSDPVDIYVKTLAFSQFGGALCSFNGKNLSLLKVKLLVDIEEFFGNKDKSCKYYRLEDYICELPSDTKKCINDLKSSGALSRLNPGEAVCVGNKSGLILRTIREGVYLSILTVKPEGKSNMSFSDFINGNRIKPGDSIA